MKDRYLSRIVDDEKFLNILAGLNFFLCRVLVLMHKNAILAAIFCAILCWLVRASSLVLLHTLELHLMAVLSLYNKILSYILTGTKLPPLFTVLKIANHQRYNSRVEFSPPISIVSRSNEVKSARGITESTFQQETSVVA